LKPKKLREKERDQAANLNLKLMEQQIHLERAMRAAVSTKAMQQAANVKKKVMNKVNLDKVMDTVQGIQEQVIKMDEFNQVIAQPLGQAYDEDELLEELEALQGETGHGKRMQPAKIPAEQVKQWMNYQFIPWNQQRGQFQIMRVMMMLSWMH
jgi:hypothetical protein